MVANLSSEILCDCALGKNFHNGDDTFVLGRDPDAAGKRALQENGKKRSANSWMRAGSRMFLGATGEQC